jgi:hypothetical protein
MALGWYGVILAVIAAAGTVAVWVTDQRAKRRVFDLDLERKTGELDARWEEWQQARGGRHRMGQPREVPSSPPAAGRDLHTDISKLPGTAGTRLPEDPYAARGSRAPVENGLKSGRGSRPDVAVTPYRAPRSHVSAADLRPVWWTVPGRPQAAPSKHGAPDTGTLPRIQLETATTGEIRAAGDRIVAAIKAGEL